MLIKINNKDFFVKYFLQPISKVSDSCCIILKENKISCVASSPDNSIILNNSFNVEESFEQEACLNVPDLKKLIRALEVIDTESIELTYDKNNIFYKNKNVSFKYHLLEEGVINRPKINVQKINSIEFDTQFDLPATALAEIIKASTFCVDSNKIYFHTSDQKVYAELTDRTRPNVDSFGVMVSDSFKGNEIKFLCLNLEVVRILSTNKIKQIHCKVNNELGVVLLDYGNNIVYTQFIVSSLTK